MRQAGNLANEQDAQRLVDYLLTIGIKARADADDGQWAVWIIDEQHLAQGRQELEEFRRQPLDPRYTQAERTATALRRENEAKAKQYAKNVVEMRDRWGRPNIAGQPVTMLLIAACVVTALLTDFGVRLDSVLPKLLIATVGPDGHPVPLARDLMEIRHGQIWRLVTPIVVHFSVIHLVFNMMMFYQLGGILERRYGKWRFAAFVLLIAATSNFAQYWMQGPMFGGMSGVVYGLFGYLWIKGNLDPSFGIRLRPDTVFIMVGFFLLCITGALGSIANWAHGIGLVVGMITGYLAAVRR